MARAAHPATSILSFGHSLRTGQVHILYSRRRPAGGPEKRGFRVFHARIPAVAYEDTSPTLYCLKQ